MIVLEVHFVITFICMKYMNRYTTGFVKRLYYQAELQCDDSQGHVM